MNNNESPRSALVDRFFRLDEPQGGTGGSISTKDVFSKKSSFGESVSALSPKRSSKAILIAAVPFDSPGQEDWGLAVNEKPLPQSPSTLSATSCSSAELYLPPLPFYYDLSESDESRNVISLDLYHYASIIQAAARGFLATKAVLRLRILHGHFHIVQLRQNAAVKIQSMFRLWYCHTLFQIATLENRLEQTEQDTKESLQTIAQKKLQDMEDYKHDMIMGAERSFRRGERYLTKSEKLSENLRAENEMILMHNEELMANNETELKRNRDLRTESMSLQRDATMIRAKLERLQRDQKALKTSSKMFEERIQEFQQVMYRVKAFSAFEAKVTAVTTDAIYKTLAVVRESCTNEELASDIIAGGMKSLKSNAEYAKLRKETARQKKLSDTKGKQQKAGKHIKADVDITEAEKAEQKKHKKSKKESPKSSKMVAKDGEKASPKKMHVRFVFAV